MQLPPSLFLRPSNRPGLRWLYRSLWISGGTLLAAIGVVALMPGRETADPEPVEILAQPNPAGTANLRDTVVSLAGLDGDWVWKSPSWVLLDRSPERPPLAHLTFDTRGLQPTAFFVSSGAVAEPPVGAIRPPSSRELVGIMEAQLDAMVPGWRDEYRLDSIEADNTRSVLRMQMVRERYGVPYFDEFLSVSASTQTGRLVEFVRPWNGPDNGLTGTIAATPAATHLPDAIRFAEGFFAEARQGQRAKSSTTWRSDYRRDVRLQRTVRYYPRDTRYYGPWGARIKKVPTEYRTAHEYRIHFDPLVPPGGFFAHVTVLLDAQDGGLLNIDYAGGYLLGPPAAPTAPFTRDPVG